MSPTPARPNRKRCRLLSVVEEAAGELQAANVGLRAQKDALIQLTDDLEHERERLAVTLRSIGDGVIATDAAGSITLMNRVAEGLTGYQEVEVVGRPLSEVFAVINERTGIVDEEPLRRVLDGGASVGPGSSALLTDRAGQAHVVAHSVAPIRDGSGERVGSAVVFQDITERRKLEDEVAERTNSRPSGCWPVASPTISTTCSPPSWATSSWPAPRWRAAASWARSSLRRSGRPRGRAT